MPGAAREPGAMARTATRRRSRRPAPSRIVLRWLALGVTVLVGLLYVGPVKSYLATRAALDGRRAEVDALRREKQRLERQLAASTSAEALLVEARKLGFVREGERLFIVKGIPACLRQKCWRSSEDEREGPPLAQRR
jgi:cell division protein FtsB